MLKRFSILILLFLPFFSFGQDSASFQEVIDSALTSKKKLNSYEEKIAYYNFVADLYVASNQTSKALAELLISFTEASNNNDKNQQAKTLSKLGNLENQRENYGKAISYFQRALLIFKELDDQNSVSKSHENIGKSYSSLYDFEKAQDALKKSLLVAASLSDSAQMANVYTLLGTLNRSNLGRAKEAISHYKKAAEIYQSIGDSTNYAWTLNRIGNCNIDLGNYKDAYSLYEQSQAIHSKEKNIIGMVAGFNNIGEIFRFQGNYAGALENYLEGLKISRETNDDRSMAILLNNIGIIYYEQSIYNVAVEYFKKSLERSEVIRFSEGMVETYTYLGLTNKKKKDYPVAMSYFDNSLNLSEEIGDMLGKGFVLNAIAELYFEKGDLNKSYNYYKEALDLEKQIQDKSGIVRSMIGMGKVRLNQNQTLVAINLLTEVLKMAKDLGLNPRVVETYNLLSQAYEKQARFAISLDFFKKYNLLNDSLQNSKVTQQIEVMQQKFVGEQREKELQLLLKERELQSAALEKNEAIIKEQSLKQTVTAMGLVLFLIAALFGWYGYNERRKAFRTLNIQKKEIEEKNTNITSSIQYAKRIQRALLTSNDYLKKVVPEHFVFYQPKDIVSGDFYWAYLSNDNKAILGVVDCTGHGVPGAFMSMIGMGLLNEIVMEHKLHHPNEILDSLRNGVITSLKQRSGEDTNDGMDISLTVWDKENNTLEFSGANNPIYILRDGKLIEIKGDKQPIGYFLGRQKPFSKKVEQLQKNDMVYLFTDGFADQFGGKQNKKYKYLHFKKLLASIAPLPIELQKEKIENEFIEWKGDFEQLDDICVLGFRV